MHILTSDNQRNTMRKNKDIIEKQINWDTDKLDIKQNVITFAQILEQEKYAPGGTSRVFSISAEFGIGKSFFCTKLSEVLEHDDIPVSMLNIWEMDFYENPLIPLLIKIKDIYVNYNKIKTITTNVAKKAGKAISKAAKLAVKYKTGINIDTFINLYKSLGDPKSDLYNDYLKFEKELEELKRILSYWAKTLDKPIVIIIDEIDRCRPDYAVKTLEILKHFFDIPGFVFVLAIDEEQLKSSVETLFGTKNFDGYKRKFINNSFLLPTPDKIKFTDFLYEKSGMINVIKQLEEKKLDLVFMANSFNPISQRHVEIQDFNRAQTSEQIIKNYFAYYSIWFNFTLRHMEQVFDRLVLFAKSVLAENILFSPDLAVFLICLHEFDMNIYNYIKTVSYITDTSKGLIGTVSEEAHKLYDKNWKEKFGPEEHDIIPIVPNMDGFSTIGSADNIRKVIHDNVDRFFKKDEKDLTKWIREEQIYGQKRAINNKQRLIKIVYTDDEKRWGNKKDFDNVAKFDVAAFKDMYFNKMDFLSNFSTPTDDYEQIN